MSRRSPLKSMSIILKAVDTAKSPAFMVGALIVCYLPLIGQNSTLSITLFRITFLKPIRPGSEYPANNVLAYCYPLSLVRRLDNNIKPVLILAPSPALTNLYNVSYNQLPFSLPVKWHLCKLESFTWPLMAQVCEKTCTR